MEILLNFINLAICASQFLLILSTALVTQKKAHRYRKFISSGLMWLSYLFFGLVVRTPLASGVYSLLLNGLGIALIVWSFDSRKSHQTERFQLWFAASINMIIYYILSYLGDVLLFPFAQLQTFMFFGSFVTVLLQVVIYLLLKRYNMYTIIQKITTNVVVERLVAFVILVNLVVISVSQYLILAYMFEGEKSYDSLKIVVTSFVLVFVVDLLISGLLIGVASYVLFEIKQRQLQENIVLQQNFYIQNLEKMQRDMRVMRHDYKNILSGLVIQVQEGDVSGVKNYLEMTVSQFDDQIGKSLKLSTYLSKIEVVELKGLLLMKLVEMEQQKIDCHLEVLTPVTSVHMDLPDLLRCVGILLDNATEELAGSLQRELNIVISQEDEDLSIMVKNGFKERPMLQKIWLEGYSTKGSDRGLGLFSYQRIVDKYPNVLKETRCEGQHFTQILKIKSLLSSTI